MANNRKKTINSTNERAGARNKNALATITTYANSCVTNQVSGKTVRNWMNNTKNSNAWWHWCAAAVCYIYSKAGYDPPSKSKVVWTPSDLKKIPGWSKISKADIQPGDIVMFGDTSYAHVEICVKHTKSAFYTVAGNTSTINLLAGNSAIDPLSGGYRTCKYIIKKNRTAEYKASTGFRVLYGIHCNKFSANNASIYNEKGGGSGEWAYGTNITNANKYSQGLFTTGVFTDTSTIRINEDTLEKFNNRIQQEHAQVVNTASLRGMDLLSSQNFVESPFVEVKIGKHTFGTWSRTGSLTNNNLKIKYPNFINSIEITKINGALNTYQLSLLYKITPDKDPNLIDRILSSVSETRKITFSYGDCANPAFIYKSEEAIITKVTSNVDFANQQISYQISCQSTALTAQAAVYNFPGYASRKGSDIIKDILENKRYGVENIFPGLYTMSLAKAKKLIADDDKEIKTEYKKDMDLLTYLDYIVSCMSANTNTDKSKALKDSTYHLVIMDDLNNDNDGAYFKVVKMGATTRSKTSDNTYEVDIGFPTNTLVTSFALDTDNSWAILYNYSEKISLNKYKYSIDNKGTLISTPVTGTVINPLSNEMTEANKTWWTQMTQFPVTAKLTIKGLLKPAMLMNNVRVNTYFFGNKHSSSGLYSITKQVDKIDASGYRTTLSLTRYAGDDDESWNIVQGYDVVRNTTV